MDSRDLSGSPPRMTGVRHPPTRFDPNPRFQVAQQKMSSSANPFRCNSAKGEKPQLFESVNTKLSHQQKYRVDDYGIAPGKRADLVVVGAPSVHEAIRLQPLRRHVIKGGREVARSVVSQDLLKS